MKINHILCRDMSDELAERIIVQRKRVWPNKPGVTDQMYWDKYFRNRDTEEVFYIEEEGTILAHARFFLRTVITERGPLDICALNSVFVIPEKRKDGLGKAIVTEIFHRINEKKLPMIFQTGVPEFYIKLGAREIDDTFFDSTNADDPQGRPWWDPYVMLHPASYDWPVGPVDLNGPGF